MRRRVALILLVAFVATSCRALVVPDPKGPQPSPDGFVSAAWWRNQQRDYLDYAHDQFSPGSYTNMINNAEWARRNHRPFNTAGITLADYANSFQRMDNFVDTADFDLTYMMNLWYGYRDVLPADVRTAMEAPYAVVQVLVHRSAADGHDRPALLLVREPPPAVPRRRVPRRAGIPERRLQQRRQHRRMAQGAGARVHRRVAHREGPLRFHRVALRRLLPEDRRRAPDDRRVGRRPGVVTTRVDGARPPLLRHRAQHPARQLRCDARPLVHEGQERRDRSRHVQHVEAPVRRHAPPVHIGRRSRRHVAGPRPALPPPRRDPARRAVEAHHGRPGAHGRPARPFGARRRDRDRRRSATRSPTRRTSSSGGSAARRPRGRRSRSRSTPWTSTACGSRTSSSRSSPSPTSPAATATWRRRSPSSSTRCWASRCSRRSTPTPTAATR